MAKNGAEYNPNNPHPLSQMKTELVWEGKYDVYGNRREVDVAGLAMPVQRWWTRSGVIPAWTWSWKCSGHAHTGPNDPRE